MARRWALPMMAAACLLLTAAPPAQAAGHAVWTGHIQERGSGVSAGWTNLAWDENGNLPAGNYFQTWVDAASYIATGDGTWMDQSVCVDHYTFSVDADGNWSGGNEVWACGPAATLTVDRRLTSGRVAASFEAEACLAWDEQTGECTDWVDFGLLAVDLTFVGSGRVETYHGTGSDGTAGLYQYVMHGTGSDRAADVAGSVTLDGSSLVDGATSASGWMSQSRYGYIDVEHLSAATMSGGATAGMTAGTGHYRERGTGFDTGWTNLVWDENGNIPAGDYYETYVSGASSVVRSDGTWETQYLCVDQYTFSFGENGSIGDVQELWACGTADTLSIDRRLTAGHVAGSLAVERCTAWDEETGECTAWDDLGTIAVDLVLTGTGPLVQWHNSNSGGTAGLYQYTAHGNGADRVAATTGDVTFNGMSLIGEPTMWYGWLFRSSYGSVDIWHM